MKLLILILFPLCMQAQSYYPINLEIQKVDSTGKELYYLKYDTLTKTTTIRGDFAAAVKDIGEMNRAQADLVAAGRAVLAQLTNTGTVRSRALLTEAILNYNRVKARYGITW